MAEMRCVPCNEGRHSTCSGDRSPTTLVTCACRPCKRFLDRFGPFAPIPDDIESALSDQEEK
jgi:hypothetical protein